MGRCCVYSRTSTHSILQAYQWHLFGLTHVPRLCVFPFQAPPVSYCTKVSNMDSYQRWVGGHCSQGTVSMAVDPSPLLLPNTSGRLAVLGMLYIMYVG